MYEPEVKNTQAQIRSLVCAPKLECALVCATKLVCALVCASKLVYAIVIFLKPVCALVCATKLVCALICTGRKLNCGVGQLRAVGIRPYHQGAGRT